MGKCLVYLSLPSFRANCNYPGCMGLCKLEMTESVHRSLIRCGYRYLTIIDVSVSKHTEKVTSITVTPLRAMEGSDHSYTSIDDTMITSYIYDRELNCQVFLLMPEEEFKRQTL